MIQHTLEPIRGVENIVWKPAFIERYSQLTDFEIFKKYSLSFLRKSIRVNTLKQSVTEIQRRLGKDWTLEPIPWCGEGFWIKHHAGRRDIGNTLEHVLGYIYVQEAASMIPPIVLDVQPHETVLDLAASPGSKTTQLAAQMNNAGVLIANDVTGDRIAALGVNLMRIGVANCVITLGKGERMTGTYDKILLDAPCSGTGTIRKSISTIEMWNPSMVSRIAMMQKRLLNHAFSLLKPGGTLVYSTCSLEPEENEAVVNDLLTNQPSARTQPITLPIARTKAIQTWNGTIFHPQIENCLRIWPQDNDTEGFFVAKILKT